MTIIQNEKLATFDGDVNGRILAILNLQIHLARFTFPNVKIG